MSGLPKVGVSIQMILDLEEALLVQQSLEVFLEHNYGTDLSRDRARVLLRCFNSAATDASELSDQIRVRGTSVNKDREQYTPSVYDLPPLRTRRDYQ